MSNFEGTLELKSPLTKECWDKLTDVELENTERMWFTTPNGKRVEYIKADVLDKIRAEIEQERDKVYQNRQGCDTYYADGLDTALDIIDKYREE